MKYRKTKGPQREESERERERERERTLVMQTEILYLSIRKLT
jgi:hypothetical protein